METSSWKSTALLVRDAYLGFPPFVVTLGLLSIARARQALHRTTVVWRWARGAWFFEIAKAGSHRVVLARLTGFVRRIKP
ncbi:hypothetical protein [Rhizobium leguminosarum]|uniref:hypothetical protein n=1 Tax=Rhizobium leguminosarum TaxID=384 RepID=UPI0036DB303C